MQRVLLLDELGEKFGPVHEYHNLRTPVDAIRLLCINYPEFSRELIESGEKGVGYKVIQSETEFELGDMMLPFGSKDLIVAPVIAGSGGAGRIIAGVALIGLAVATGGVSLGMTGFVGASGIPLAASYSTTMAAIAIGGNIGIALTLGGISQMLSPQPQEAPQFTPGATSTDRGPGSIVRGSDGRQSYSYRGAINSVGAGATIPVVFGKALIGSHIVSADMQVTDESDPLTQWIKTPSPDTMRIQGEKLDSVFKETSGIKSRSLSASDVNSIIGGSTTKYLAAPHQLNLTSNTRQQVVGGNIPGEFSGATDVAKFQIAFRLNNGLYDEIAGAGSTKVDGFVTFKIIVENTDLSSTPDVATIQVTAQGLMSGSQSYSWVHWFTYGKIEYKDNYLVYVEPVDYSANLNVNTLEVLQVGYYFVNPDT
tara:strand:+ start:1426 stop:2697 length:1272 start_codon:yes stop_codon:yes gene_type:complete